MIDSHAHLQFADSFNDLDEVINEAAAAGIEAIINVGVNPKDSRLALKLSQTKNLPLNLYASAGLHPHEAELGDKALDEIHDMAEDVIAIGECGLDYYRNLSPRDSQKHALRAQIEIALEHNLPIIFHVRDAWLDFFKIVADYSSLTGVIHSFTGHPEQVKDALNHPGQLYFGLNGIMTFTKDSAQLAAARLIPTDRLLLETDCPFLAPPPHRGQRNQPSYLPIIGEFIAKLYSLESSKLIDQTTANAKELFQLD